MNKTLFEDHAELTLSDVCERCGVKSDAVVTYIREGLIDQPGDDETKWRFTRTHIVHIQKAYRIERELRLNPAGSVLVMELLEQIDELRAKLQRYQRLDDD